MTALKSINPVTYMIQHARKLSWGWF